MAMIDTATAIAPAEAAKPARTFDACFLRSETISAYLEHIASNGMQPDARFRLFDWPVNWGDEGPFPLALCEFLAYKTALAYADREQIKSNLGDCGIDVVRGFEFFDSSVEKDGAPRRGDTQGYGFVIGDTAFIVMRGTWGIKDWADNFMVVPTTYPWPLVWKRTLKRIGEAEPRRHLGWARAWANVAPQIYAWLKALPDKGYDIKHICLAGHSLGGAIAFIGAYELARQENIPPIAAVVTFAAPAVGGRTFNKIYEEDLKLGNRTLRLESIEDTVPKIPGYYAVGRKWRIEERPMIIGRERFWAFLLGLAGWASMRSDNSTSPGGQSSPANKPGQGDTSPTAPGGGAEQKAPRPAAPDNRNFLLVVVGIVVVFVGYVITRGIIKRFRAHGMDRRYAGYLSTLSYRQFRDHRLNGLSEASDDAPYERSTADLDRHLAFIRGALPTKEQENRQPKPFVFPRDYPVRVLTKEKAKQFRKETEKDQEDEKQIAPSYAGYIW